MESRLVPLNALIGLCSNPGMLYPSTFSDCGYKLRGLEVPVTREGETVVVDAVMFQEERNMVLAGEAKAGSNIDEEQARRYKGLEVDGVIRSASITLKHPGNRWVQPVYCCSSDNASGVLKGLKVAGLACPVLAFNDVAIENLGSAFMDAVLQGEFQEPQQVSGPHPQIVKVDEYSPVESFIELIAPHLVNALARNRDHISIPALAEQSLRFFVLYGKRARNTLIKKVDAAAREVSARISETCEYRPRTGDREFAVLHFLKSPEWGGRQGRTQAYQAIERALRAESKRPVRRMSHPRQASFFDVLRSVGEEYDPTNGEEGR